MRDVIWTIIVLWVVWKIYDAIKKISTSQTKTSNNTYQYKKEGEVKIDNLNINNKKSNFHSTDAEYVDYEEIK